MRLLLDENCPRKLAEVLTREEPLLSFTRIQEWHDGRFMGRDDHEILAAAAPEGLVLFTFDGTTIPSVLTDMAVADQAHAGVVFASSKRMPQRAHMSFAHALVRLWRAEKDADWTNRVVFLSLSSD
jgi:hypothetical protein